MGVSNGFLQHVIIDHRMVSTNSIASANPQPFSKVQLQKITLVSADTTLVSTEILFMGSNLAFFLIYMVAVPPPPLRHILCQFPLYTSF
jgi:hypothetical protein